MIIATAGRRIDASDATVKRFPLSQVNAVRERLLRVFVDHRGTALVSSAACGADLLALDVARQLGMRWRIVLPFAREAFRASSVVDRPGDWGPLFDQFCAEAERHGDLITLPPRDIPHAGYVAATQRILDEAASLAGQQTDLSALHATVLAVAIWDGKPRGADDLTQHFLELARTRGFQTRTVPTM